MARKTPRRPRRARTLSAEEAAAELGVKLPTLYAYVSRGLLRSQTGAHPRSRLYPREDVERLKQRREQRRDPSKAAALALDWGAPVLDSALTLIGDGALYYRGQNMSLLARERSVEEVAGLLWVGNLEAGHDLFPDAVEPLLERFDAALAPLEKAHPSERLQVLLRLLAAEDPASADLRAEQVRRCGARLLTQLASAVARLDSPSRGGIARALQQGWAPQAPGWQRVISAALIACADHEFNVSSFTARCVASAGATPYDVVSGGLAALRGFRHGGYSDRVEAWLGELGVANAWRAPPDRLTLSARLAERLRRGEHLPGFGHRLYPEGDPRYSLLVGVLAEAVPDHPVAAAAGVVAAEAGELLGLRPNVDFALATLSASLGLRPGGAFTLFALGRVVGWIAHALEEYERGRLIRPRARYTGPAPATD